MSSDHLLKSNTADPVANSSGNRNSHWFEKHRFGAALVVSLAVGGIIRFFYVFSFFGRPDPIIGGDGFSYHLEALRLADGLGYTASMWDVGAQASQHPPLWVTVLGGFSALGVDTINEQQLLGVFIGLLVIVMAALVGRLVFGDPGGIAAGAIAAIYPGFWVLDAQILSEPIALVLLGISIIAFYRLSNQPNVRHAIEVGLSVGLLVLARSEQIALLVLLAPIFFLKATYLSIGRRAVLGLIVIGVVALLLSPWVIHNSNRFEEPVLISSNMGVGLLTGNCSSTFEGELKGFYDMKCLKYADKPEGKPDRSVMDRLQREAAFNQIRENLDKLPLAIAARYGRAFGMYRTNHTVTEVAKWQGTPTWPIWAWVVSFWVVLAFAIIGALAAIRSRIDIMPLVVPILVMLAVVAAFFGEPRYHTLADLSFVVLAGFGLVTIATKFQNSR